MDRIGTGRDRTASIEVSRRLNQYKQRDGKGCSRKKASGIGEGDVLNRKRFLDG